jgi:cytochrome c556
MRKTLGFGVLGSVLVLGLSVAANVKPPADFQAAMKENGATIQKLGKDVEAKDYEAIAAGAAIFKKNFMGPVGKYFTDAKNDDGLKQCTAAYTAADGLEKAAKAKDEAGVATARKTLQSTCGGCHTAHREQLPDKTYEIKTP